MFYTACQEGALHLVAGRYNGRLEVCQNNGWETVCIDGFDTEDSEVACRQLEFLGASSFRTVCKKNAHMYDSNTVVLGNQIDMRVQT